jgi:hypothetical protein
MAKCDLVYRLDWQKLHPSRAGIIVYTYHLGKLMFALGRDTLFGELTDFGGGVKYHKDGDALNGALREFMEESLLAFGVVKPTDLRSSLAIYDKSTVVIFYYTRVDPGEIVRTFRRRSEVLENLEVRDIIWLSLQELSKAIEGKDIYSRVCSLLKDGGLLQ